ncbi:hypothetical protein ACPC54_35745 [Kitasatospora sp. NPDC094028]
MAGQATQHPEGPAADDVVLLAGPGVGVDKASQPGAGADHVHVGAARNDPEANAPSPGMPGGPGELIHEQINHPGEQARSGTDPAGADFGGQRLPVADGTITDPTTTTSPSTTRAATRSPTSGRS